MALDWVEAVVRTKPVVGVPGSENNGPGKDAEETSRADCGMILFSWRIVIPVELREDKATSKPVFIDAPWKQVKNFPPKPKLKTGARDEVRPKGSFAPRRDGEGAYAVDWTGFMIISCDAECSYGEVSPGAL